MQHKPSVVDLLFATFPLIRLTRGEKRVRLQRAWISAADSHAAGMLHLDEALLPVSPADARHALMGATLRALRQDGLDGVGLRDLFAEVVDGGGTICLCDADTALEQLQALVAVMAARRLQARDPVHLSEGAGT